MLKSRKQTFIAGFIALCSLTAFAQHDAGYWRAASKTAQSITGDIAFGGDKLSINFTRYTIAQIRKLTGAEVSAVFDVPADTNNGGDLYRLSIPGQQKFLHKNTLCGSDDTQWLATFAEGRQLHVAFFSGSSMPVFTVGAISNSSDLCGTFLYMR